MTRVPSRVMACTLPGVALCLALTRKDRESMPAIKLASSWENLVRTSHLSVTCVKQVWLEGCPQIKRA
jgi:hypothetical protein